ncbi:MAG: hypothetical protein NT164_08660 [Verrucomicrobiae bacterium]|nr:hypothetical protein [Verrucomicrobiae bacterium]
MLSRPTLVEAMSFAAQTRRSCGLQMKAFTPGSQRHVASLRGTSTLREYLHLWLLHAPPNSSLPARFPLPTLNSNLTKSNTPLSIHNASFSKQSVALHF